MNLSLPPHTFSGEPGLKCKPALLYLCRLWQFRDAAFVICGVFSSHTTRRDFTLTFKRDDQLGELTADSRSFAAVRTEINGETNDAVR